MTWRSFAIILGLLLVVQTWRACHRVAPSKAASMVAECESASAPSASRTRTYASHDDHESEASAAEPTADTGAGLPSINGFKLPAWTLYFAPMPGESMLSYRDRMVPLAQAALAPHRERVARGRDDFADKVHLDAQQRAALDASVQEAASQIQDKVMNSLLSGQLMPKSFKPMTGVTLARDVLDSIDKANQRFVNSLREDQKAQLGQHPFDFADYLLFSARWEDALGVTN
jgi:hypothetical protein